MAPTEYLAWQSEFDFQWGTHDCATLVLRWLDLCLGRNVMSSWAGLYHDEISCEDFITKNGGFINLTESILTKDYGWQKPSVVVMPRSGQIVFASLGPIECLGLRVAKNLIAMRTTHSICFSPQAKIIEEWAIPCRL
jgi:hypothetical protein